jgi:hypothetical protein
VSGSRLALDLQVPLTEDVGIGNFSVSHVDCELLWDVGVGGGVRKDELDVLYPLASKKFSIQSY